jgi:nicotinate-nucleotide pyrophosphorylase (carboxylating)
MMGFSAAEETVCRRLVQWALDEDLGAAGDLTSQYVIPANQHGRAVFRSRAAGVIAGLPALNLVFAAIDIRLALQIKSEDSKLVEPGTRLAMVSGPLRSLLAGERVALNFLQRLSGVATRTRDYVEAIKGYSCRILDTRKSTPGWRLLEKYAVRCGGGHNHRMGLYDAILIKDNHLAPFGAGPAAIQQAVRMAREKAGHSLPVIIEVERLDQLDAALTSAPDVVLLDNMDVPTLRLAVNRRQALGPGVLLEASGGVNLSTVRAIAATGVDRISVGELTHSAPALDIALDYEAL